MPSFDQRLLTFKGWPYRTPRPDKLAHAGFVYTRHKDLVECKTCGVKVGAWQPEDDPIIEHKKWSPNCPFIMSLLNGGVPIAEDTCGIYGIRSTNSQPFIEGGGGDGVVKGARYPMFTTKEERLKSFKDWPKSMKQRPAELAEAGFFYLNSGDKTVCFYCGIGCKHWEEDDRPWEEHAKYSPNCEYLRLHKDDDFIKSCKVDEAAAAPALEMENGRDVSLMMGENNDEDKKVNNKTICKVCLDNEISVVFFPCGHTACLDCAPALTKCPICRAPIQKFIKIYMA